MLESPFALGGVFSFLFHIAQFFFLREQTLFESFDILSYLDERAIPYNTSGKNVSSGWIGISCPSCSDHSDHLGVHLGAKTFSCFRCGDKGTALQLVMKIEECSKSRAIEIIRKFSKKDFVYRPTKRETAETISQPKGITKKFDPVFKEYLEKRRYSPDYLIKKYDLYSGGYVGDFPLQIVIPVYLKGNIVTYQGRDITNKANTPYKAFPIEKSILAVKQTLYNIDSVKDRAVVVEGITDAWRIGEGAVATFGTQFTDEQVRLLLEVKGTIFIMYDAEEDAQKQAYILGNILRSSGKEVEILIIDKGDPDNLEDHEVAQLRRELRL